MYDVLDVLEPLAQEKGCTVSQLSLAWNLSRPGITSPIIGPRTLEQLEDDLGSLEATISEEDARRIEEVVPPGDVVSPFYEADFGPHLYR